MRPVEDKIVALLREGMMCPVAKVAGRCREILELEKALFTFVRRMSLVPVGALTAKERRGRLAEKMGSQTLAQIGQ
jgi:hypothetical protein